MHACIHSFIQPSIRSVVHSFHHSFCLCFIHAFNQSILHACMMIRPIPSHPIPSHPIPSHPPVINSSTTTIIRRPSKSTVDGFSEHSLAGSLPPRNAPSSPSLGLSKSRASRVLRHGQCCSECHAYYVISRLPLHLSGPCLDQCDKPPPTKISGTPRSA